MNSFVPIPYYHLRCLLSSRKTEILDVAPIDVFSGLSKEFLGNFPPQLVNKKLLDQALDFEFHWVNESGQEASLTAGTVVKPTVSSSSLLRVYFL